MNLYIYIYIYIYIYYIIFLKKYYISYIAGIIEKYKYGLLQYESEKYILSISIILIKIKLILIKISQKLLLVIYTYKINKKNEKTNLKCPSNH